MKTKRHILALAAMLLGSLGAFAQNGETLKGDVNGDGKIDVEDVTSVVDIILSGKTYGYFYFGTREPTADNFTSLPGAVASYTSIGEAVGATVSIAEGETLYMLCPAAWMKGKHVEVEDGEGNTYDFVEDTDAGAIPSYVIYKTQAFNEATDAILKFNNSSAETYYWYVGTSKPTSLDYEGVTTISEYPTEQTFTNPSETTKCYVYTLTNSDKTVNFYDPADPDDALLKAEDVTTINGFKITYISADGSTPFKIAKGGSIIIRIS